ncbi:MAG: hypothetical protein SH856_05900 [Flavobacteriales bacterium]|nr:hypothetical protein [Flavobacteriales bacterium]
MQTSATIKIMASDLNVKCLRSIKAFFGNREVEVSDAERMDETAYLISSTTKAQIIRERLAYLDAGDETVKMSLEDLHTLAKDSNAKP